MACSLQGKWTFKSPVVVAHAECHVAEQWTEELSGSLIWFYQTNCSQINTSPLSIWIFLGQAPSLKRSSHPCQWEGCLISACAQSWSCGELNASESYRHQHCWDVTLNRLVLHLVTDKWYLNYSEPPVLKIIPRLGHNPVNCRLQGKCKGIPLKSKAGLIYKKLEELCWISGNYKENNSLQQRPQKGINFWQTLTISKQKAVTSRQSNCLYRKL